MATPSTTAGKGSGEFSGRVYGPELPGRGDLRDGDASPGERDREHVVGNDGGLRPFLIRVQSDQPWTARPLDREPGPTAGPSREAQAPLRQGEEQLRGGPGTHGAGDRPRDDERDPGPGSPTGCTSRQVRFGTTAVMNRDNEESDGTSPRGAHVKHNEPCESFESCSSGSEDSSGEVFAAQHQVHRPAKVHAGEILAEAALSMSDFTFGAVVKILAEYDMKPTNNRRERLHGDPGEGGRCNLGYYAYGTFKGINRRTTKWPMLTRYLNGFLVDQMGSASSEQGRATWSSLALLSNCPTAVHTDKNNVKGSYNCLISFGGGTGGEFWIQEPGGGASRRNSKGQDIEGKVCDIHEQGWEFDPRLLHATEPFVGERWFLAGYTPRTFPEATKQEKKILRDLGFPMPNKAEIRTIKKQDKLCQEAHTVEPTPPSTSTSRPIRSRRRDLRRTAMMLSVLFTIAFSTMCGAVQAVLPTRSTPETAMLEIGGLSATCRLAEYEICDQHLLEPLLVDDILDNDHPLSLGIGYIESMTLRRRPGQLWVHMRPEWNQDDIYHDLVVAVSSQLGEGRAVVFEREVEDQALWEGLTNGWEDAGYDVTYDFTEDGHQYVRVVQVEPENYVHTVCIGENETDDELLPAVHDPEGREEAPPMQRGAQAISFPPSVPETIASSLRRLHQNLGHPSTSDFVRHLGLAGASREVLKGARSLECQVCQRTRNPAIPKPAKIAPCYRVNEMVGTDLFYVHASEGRRHQLLSIVDFSSAYQVVVPVDKKDTATLERAFCASWVQVFGAPSVVAVDMENGLEKSLARVGDWTGTRIRSAAGQAHHQAGFTERQGAIWKAIFSRINEEFSVCHADFHLAVSAVSTAKNQLTRISGFSPCQHVFGATPGLPEDLLEGPHAGHDLVVDDKHAREVALRTAARSAYFHVQTDERVRRALAGRARVEGRIPESGKNNKKGCWIGPGTVIGREGVNLWITRAGRCVLCAPEHVRLATAEELGQAFSMRVAQEDLDRLLNADSDEPGVFDDEEDEEMVNIDAAGAGDIVFDMEDDPAEEDPAERRGLRRDLVPVPPRVLKRQRRKGRGEEELPGGDEHHDVHMIKKARTPRSREKQLEKEMPWSMIPESMRPAFREKEMVQWREHVDTGALEVLSVAESETVRRVQHPSRILSSRFAYRDKHLGRRRADPTIPWKPKSRLVVGGHQDPDVGVADIAVDSPTVSRASLIYPYCRSVLRSAGRPLPEMSRQHCCKEWSCPESSGWPSRSPEYRALIRGSLHASEKEFSDCLRARECGTTDCPAFSLVRPSTYREFGTAWFPVPLIPVCLCFLKMDNPANQRGTSPCTSTTSLSSRLPTSTGCCRAGLASCSPLTAGLRTVSSMSDPSSSWTRRA